MTPFVLAVIEADIVARVAALPNHTTAVVRALRRDYSKQLATAEPAFMVALALRLLAQPDAVYRFIAYEIVCYHRAALQSLRATDLTQLGAGMDSWEDVDTFACYLSGPAWRERQVNDALIERWARSHDRWWRRAAVVSTVPLNTKARGGRGDAERTIRICRMVVADRDDMLTKALSWALRELAKRDPEAVRAFLVAHDDQLAARVKREVQNKLRTGLKSPRHDR